MKYKISILLLFIFQGLFSQDPNSNQTLDEVVVSTTKLDLPFSKNFRTITIVGSSDIKNSPATNVSDLLQEITGVDIRRRGLGGVQGDLYIRGAGLTRPCY